MLEAHRINENLIKRAIEMEGTCTGEHGIFFYLFSMRKEKKNKYRKNRKKKLEEYKLVKITENTFNCALKWKHAHTRTYLKVK
jgi:FAD/FMN-containing dehydrogenase